MSEDLVQFEDFVLNRGAYELRRGDVVIPLQRIPLELLCLLVERRGQVVTRAEILERVWGKGVFVDSENSINTAVRKVRRALGDNPEAPRFVVTVPARGYRFVAEILEPKINRAEQFRARPPGLMVGRERELASLLSGLDDAASRRGRLFLISGEPGVGKTRLADEVAVAADAKQMALLVGHCSEHREAVAYLPFVEILENFTDRVSNMDSLRRAVGEQGPELARLLPKLKNILPELALPPDLPPAQARRQLFNCFCDFAARIASEQPALMILDDLHWADDSTLALLDHLTQRLSDLPLMVIATYRDAELNVTRSLAKTLEDLLRGRLATRVRLKGLPRDEVAAMLKSLSGKSPPAAVVGEIYAETEGNPFFVEELFRHLEEENRLYDSSGQFRSELKIAELDAPPSVRLVVARRLARLSGLTQKMLATAAVIGSSFSFKLLEAAAATEGLLECLDEAERAGLIFSGAHSPEARFEFFHELIRQVLISGQSAARRQRLHLEVAQAMEQVYAGAPEDNGADLAHHYDRGGDAHQSVEYLGRAGVRAEDQLAYTEAIGYRIGPALEEIHQPYMEAHLAELAHHFREAGDINKAVDYSIRAGAGAKGVFAYDNAIALWQAALDLMPESPEYLARRADLLERTAELFGLTASDGEKQFKYLRQALRLYKSFGRPEAATRVEARIAGWLAMRGSPQDFSHALDDSQEREKAFGRDRESRVALVWHLIAIASAAGLAGNSIQSVATSGRAMEISAELGDPVLGARAAISHAANLFASGQLAQSFTLVRRASNEADRLNDNITGTGILTVVGHTLFWLCDPAEAVKLIQIEINKPRMAEASLLRTVLYDWLRIATVLNGRLREIDEVVARAHGDPPLEGLIAFYRGEGEQADVILNETANRAHEGKEHVRACSSSHWLARSRRALGHHFDAEAILNANLAFCIAGPLVPFELHTRTELASIYAEMGQPGPAHPHLARCREVLAAGEDWRGLTGHVARAEAVVAAAESRFEAANEQFASAVEIYRRYQVPFEEAETLHYWARALLAAGDSGQALEKLDAATELYQRHGAGEPWLERIQTDRLRTEGPVLTEFKNLT
jgi:DNA-binding winged helix-turn-helix (wHTH) protein/tetratricopeptide (TPR) repeat protein